MTRIALAYLCYLVKSGLPLQCSWKFVRTGELYWYVNYIKMLMQSLSEERLIHGYQSDQKVTKQSAPLTIHSYKKFGEVKKFFWVQSFFFLSFEQLKNKEMDRDAKGLTSVSQLSVATDRDNDQKIPQDVHHRGEDQHAGQRRYSPRGSRARTQRASNMSQFRAVLQKRDVFWHAGVKFMCKLLLWRIWSSKPNYEQFPGHAPIRLNVCSMHSEDHDGILPLRLQLNTLKGSCHGVADYSHIPQVHPLVWHEHFSDWLCSVKTNSWHVTQIHLTSAICVVEPLHGWVCSFSFFSHASPVLKLMNNWMSRKHFLPWRRCAVNEVFTGNVSYQNINPTGKLELGVSLKSKKS